MTLDSVTSLADLAFKAKTNKYYQRLTILTAQWIGYFATTYEEAIEVLYRVAHNNNTDNCATVVREVNNNRCEIEEDPEPAPTVDELILIKQKKTDTIVEEELKKKENQSTEGWAYRPSHIEEEYERLRRNHYDRLEREWEEQCFRWRMYNDNSYYRNNNYYNSP